MYLLKHWKYRNLTFLFLSIVFALILSRSEQFHTFLLRFGELGYIGGFIAGIFFTSSFTVATATVILLILAETLSPIELGILAGLGAVLGDLTIYKFVKDDLVKEIDGIYERLGGNHINHVLHTKYFSWTLPVIGAFIIASPLPDEIGVSLLGISKVKVYKFIIISFIFNTIGVLLVITASNFIKP
ncbi:MAG: hypothetical protein HY344_04385 [Candidatus Levybacteria bacterium]|nr:hypothetical protein [Candidatus Levybacteria bacterium]